MEMQNVIWGSLKGGKEIVLVHFMSSYRNASTQRLIGT